MSMRIPRDLALRALTLVLAAEERAGDEELAAVCREYHVLTGDHVDHDRVLEEADRVSAGREDSWDLMESAVVTPEWSEALVKAGIRVLMADADMDASEIEVVWRLGRSMDLGNVRMRVLLNEVWRERERE